MVIACASVCEFLKMPGYFGNSQKFSGPNLASTVDIPILLQTFWPKTPTQ
jgi:hypothetical protein